MRLGVLGGSFDPVHYGHLLLAECCRETCALDEVWFCPAAVPPHKQHRSLSDDKHRVEMLRLATAGHHAFRVSLREIERGGVSYTVDTLEALRGEQPDRHLFLLLGADMLADLPNWRQPQRICELATPVVVRRGPAAIDWEPLRLLLGEERFQALQVREVAMPLVDYSSTAIREAVGAGHSIRYRTPRAVEKYMETHGLYRLA